MKGKYFVYFYILYTLYTVHILQIDSEHLNKSSELKKKLVEHYRQGTYLLNMQLQRLNNPSAATILG